MRISTMPEFIRRRFGTRTSDFLACYGLFSIIAAWVGADMFVGSKVLSQMSGFADWKCLLVLAAIFTSFTVLGGFAAVMVTDTFQAVLMIVSMVTLNVIAFQHVGSLKALVHGVPADYWQLFRPAGDAKYPWPALVFGYPVCGVAFWCADQTIVQRMLGARDLRQAQLGALYTGFLKILPPFLFMMPGIFCLVLQPHLKDPNDTFVTMLAKYMPVGMTGLMISVLAAASVAGVSGGLNAFTTIFTMDIYKRQFQPRRLGAPPQASQPVGGRGHGDGRRVRLAVPALEIEDEHLRHAAEPLRLFSPPVAVVFLSGIGWRRATAAGARATLYLGSAVFDCLGRYAVGGLARQSAGFAPGLLAEVHAALHDDGLL